MSGNVCRHKNQNADGNMIEREDVSTAEIRKAGRFMVLFGLCAMYGRDNGMNLVLEVPDEKNVSLVYNKDLDYLKVMEGLDFVEVDDKPQEVVERYIRSIYNAYVAEEGENVKV